MDRKDKVIRSFISRLATLYPNLQINFSYDEAADQFSIWHLDPDLQFNNKKFLENVGQLIQEILYSEDVFNFSFGYDYFKANAAPYTSLYNLTSEMVVRASVSFDESPNYSLSSGPLYGRSFAFDATDLCSVSGHLSQKYESYNVTVSNADVPNYSYDSGRLAA